MKCEVKVKVKSIRCFHVKSRTLSDPGVPTLCVADSHSEPSCLPAADSSVVLSQDIVETDHMHNILTES